MDFKKMTGHKGILCRATCPFRWRPLLRNFAVMLLGLSIYPVQSAQALDAPEIRAAQWLTGQQHLDGSWGAFEEAKPLYTATAVPALASIYQRNVAYYKGIAWLENHHVPNVDYKARRILALAPRGNNVEPDLEYLRTVQDISPAGNNGWGLTGGYTGSPIDTAMVLQAFALVGEQANVQPALDFLKSTQLTGVTKGWPVSHEASNDPSVTSDPISTALVIQALILYAASDSTLATPITNAVSTLEATVSVNSPTLAKAHAAFALLQENITSIHGQLLLDSLRATQLTAGIDSGSWAGEVYTTAMALQALALAGGAGLAAQEDLVFIPDVKLREAINQALGKNKADSLTKGELAQLTDLNAAGLGITDLTGLEWAVNLKTADLASNQIADIGALQNLVNLMDVKLQDNPLSTIADSDNDGAFDAEEAFAGTHPFHATSHPIFHVETDVLSLQSLQASLSGLGALTDAWHTVWEDFDGDGDLDVVVYVHGADEQWETSYTGPTKGRLWLFENVNGTYVQRPFTNGEEQPNGDVTELFAVDYDNDGLKDLVMVLHPITTTSSGEDTNAQHRDLVVFKNVSTTTLQLADWTQTVGLPGPALTAHGIRSAAVVDLNRDGYLDIFVTGPSTSHFWQFNPVTQIYQDVMGSTNLPANLCCQFVTVDLDNDGLVDLVSQGGANVFQLFKNNGNGTFTEKNNLSATSLGPLNNLVIITQVVPADYNRDGMQDLVVFQTQLWSETPQIFAGGTIQLVKNLSTPEQFDLQLDTSAVGFESSGSSFDFSYGGTVGDLDNDGDLDILITSLETTDWTTIYRNNADGSYSRLREKTNLRKNGNRASHLGDFNQDGQLDLLLSSGYQGGYTEYLYTNLETDNHFLDVKVIGKLGPGIPSSGLEAIGTLVKVEAGGAIQWQQVLVRFGQGRLLHFGLGTATSAKVTVFWPSGTPPTIVNVSAVDNVVAISEP